MAELEGRVGPDVCEATDAQRWALADSLRILFRQGQTTPVELACPSRRTRSLAAQVDGQAGNGPKPFAFEVGNEIIVRLTLGATLRTPRGEGKQTKEEKKEGQRQGLNKEKARKEQTNRKKHRRFSIGLSIVL